MESPVVLDKPPEYHGNARDNEEEGSGAWSSLAARHPDIAARLRQRPATWARKRRPASQDAADDFGDGFGGFDSFPFDDIPPEFRDHFPTNWNRRFSARDEPQTEAQAPPPPRPEHSQSPQQQTAATQTEHDAHSHLQPHLPQYGLRNTVDLGQKSPADPSLVDAEERNQRSMSAPPDSRDEQSHPHASNMSAQNHQEPEHAPQPSNVRHIPIFVEGRDEPVINKSVDHGAHFGESKPQQPHADREQYFPDEGPAFHPPPNFSRAFGTPFNKGAYRQGPQPFVQQKVYPQNAFARGASPQRSQSPKAQPHAEEPFIKVPVHHDHAPPKPEPQSRPQQPAPPQKQTPPPQKQTPPPQKQTTPPQKQATPPPQPKPTGNDPITQILSIQTDVLNLMSEVENFTGTKKDKRYLFLDEMLTRNLIKLDNIETDGKENIRQARKEAIKCIQKCIAVLEAKADKGSSALPSADVEMEKSENSEQVTENGVEVEMNEGPKDENVEPQVEQSQPAPTQESKKDEPEPEEKAEVAESAISKAGEPQAADTRPADQQQPSTDNKEVVDKPSPKKGTKNVKKRDKSKDKKDTPKDSDKEQTSEKQKGGEDSMQVDDKGDKTNTQAMEVDGAASQ